MPADDKAARRRVRRADRQESLGGAAALPADAHQPGERARRRQADPRRRDEREVVHRRDRAAVEGPRRRGITAPSRARRGREDVPEGDRDVQEDRGGVRTRGA